MALSDSDKLRLLLGEVIPAGGTASDTMFSADDIDTFLLAGSQNAAALQGWKAKAAQYSNLVTVTEGNSSRAMSDLYKAALEMVQYYEDAVAAEAVLEGTKGRVVIGKISRGKA